jgi:hypothetical protein
VVDRDQAGGVRPVLEEDATPVDEPLERAAVVDAEAAPQGEMVRALDDVDRVELDPAGRRREAFQARRGETAGARAIEQLARQEERAHGVAGNGRSCRHVDNPSQSPCANGRLVAAAGPRATFAPREPVAYTSLLAVRPEPPGA